MSGQIQTEHLDALSEEVLPLQIFQSGSSGLLSPIILNRQYYPCLGHERMPTKLQIPQHMEHHVMRGPLPGRSGRFHVNKHPICSKCNTTGISTLPTPRAHVTPRRLCSGRLRLGSASAQVGSPCLRAAAQSRPLSSEIINF